VGAVSDEFLRVCRLTKRFGDEIALAGVALEIRPGEVLGLIGPNGSGKTTLLECLSGLLPVDDGEVLWRGKPLPRSHGKQTMFYIPDGIAPYAEHRVLDVLRFIEAVYRRPRRLADEIFTAVALDAVLRKRVGALSKGYRRRLLLALGLLAPHPLLLMDEPFDGFDLRQTREMMTLLRRAAGDGRTLLLSIHQLSDAERMCDRFVLLSAGRVRGEGSLDALRQAVGRTQGNLEQVFLALA
jgi:ABC-2 type transport system ATP-binding protein